MKEVHGSTLAIDIEEQLDGNHDCPECGKLFVPAEWEESKGYHYPRSGGCTYYECPNECPGKIALHV